MEKRVAFGFRPIIEDFLRDTARQNGKQLAESNHVHSVLEINRPGQAVTVSGKVIPQTSLKNGSYDVEMTVRETLLSNKCFFINYLNK